MNKVLTPDLCVIGGGSGGLSVAAGAVQMGASVLLVEGHKMGGDCLNYGCVPSKALLSAAAQPGMKFAAAKDHVAKVIAGIAPHDSVERFQGLGVQVIEDYAAFTGPREMQAGGYTIRARRFVLATGSSPFVPPIKGLENVPYHTNETLFEDRTQPRHLLIIGAGPIGLEMAQAHRRLGSKVTVFEGLKALGRDDRELAAIVLGALKDEGIDIFEDAKVAEVSGKAGAITLKLEDGRSFQGDQLLVAVGRRANIDRLNLAAAGVDTAKGAIVVNTGLRSTNRRVYAIGDVAGGLQFTHVANYHAGLVIRSALFGLPVRASTAHIPKATYTSPELASVGLSEDEAREKYGDKLEIVRAAYSENDRARATGQTAGLLKVFAYKGRPVGAAVAGVQAGELINIWALAISAKLKLSAVAGMVSPYPTLGELNKRAAGAYFTPRLFESKWVKRIVRLVQRF